MRHVISSSCCYETVSLFQSLNDQQKKVVSNFGMLFIVVYAPLANLHRNGEIIFGILALIVGFIGGIE